MNAGVRLVRWLNGRCPRHRYNNRLAHWAARRLDVPAEPAVYDGVLGRYRMRLDIAGETERWMCLNNYEPVVRHVFRRALREGDVCVDVGANVGFMTLLAAGLVGPTGKVYAFEAMPPTVKTLRENVSLNGLDQVTIVDKACWDAPGEATIHEFDQRDAGSASLAELAGETVTRSHTVETVRLDDVVDAPVRLIKLDVEGAELYVLKGGEKLLTQSRPDVLIELNRPAAMSFGYEPVESLDWLLEALPGYRIRHLHRRRIRKITRNEVAARIAERPQKHVDLWLSPT